MSSAVIFQIQSFFIVSLMTFGLIKKSQKMLHAKVMTTAIVWDIILVLQIELTRGAILKAAQMLTNPWILNLHVALALTTVLLSLFLLFSGNQLKKGNLTLKNKHRIIGITTYILRLATFGTSFLAVIPKK